MVNPMVSKSRLRILILAFTASCGGHLGYSYTDALTALQVAYRSEGAACVAVSKTAEAAGECLAQVKEKYAPLWLAAETATGFCNAIREAKRVSAVADEYCRGVYGEDFNMGRIIQ